LAEHERPYKGEAAVSKNLIALIVFFAMIWLALVFFTMYWMIQPTAD
jgi:hypothetical protein